MMINVKSFLEIIFCRISINSTFMNLLLCKKAVLYTATLMHRRVAQPSRDLFSTKQGNGSEMAFMARSHEINTKNMKS